MRTIKFRAFILGKMYDVKSLDFDKEYGITITTDGGFYNIGHGTKDEHGHLMQYTGLKDKNGVEIYEGDIVQRGDGRKDHIVYLDGEFTTAYEGWDVWWLVKHRIEDLDENVIVIGNIHEGEKNE